MGRPPLFLGGTWTTNAATRLAFPRTIQFPYNNWLTHRSRLGLLTSRKMALGFARLNRSDWGLPLKSESRLRLPSVTFGIAFPPGKSSIWGFSFETFIPYHCAELSAILVSGKVLFR